MPPIYELSRPYFYHHLQSSQEYLRKAGKQIVDVNNENSGAGLYMLVRISLVRENVAKNSY